MAELSELICASPEETALFARLLGAALKPGDCVLLDGPVGAGKTHFARALIQSRQGERPEDVPSPTYTLVQTYTDAAGVELWHADLYRLTDPSELAELGLDEALADGIALIEWPDRMGAAPAGALTLTLIPAGAEARRIVLSGSPARWGRAVRAAAAARVLARAGRAGDHVQPLAGDASVRRYLRLSGVEGHAVLMEDPPPGSMARFVEMTHWLRQHGLHAPAILDGEPGEGVLLLEDLGDDLVARVLDREPGREAGLYAAITDLLVELHGHRPPDFVPPLDGPELARQSGLFAEYYPAASGAPGLGEGVGPAIEALHAQLCADARPVVGLRDFHAENIVVLPGGLGLLDYQDAVAVHPAYDLVSLLQDARRDVSAATEAACVARYVRLTEADPEHFAAAYALLGAQRGLRIMGIFTRLCLMDGKPRYLDFMPRVWDAVWRDLAHPALAPLAAQMAGIPAPDAAIIERIRARCGTMRPKA